MTYSKNIASIESYTRLTRVPIRIRPRVERIHEAFLRIHYEYDYW